MEAVEDATAGAAALAAEAMALAEEADDRRRDDAAGEVGAVPPLLKGAYFS
jgi:hypothetical protein